MMTNTKKYSNHFTEIIESDNQHFAFADTVEDAEKICDKLNNQDFRLKLSQYEKNELKQENSELRITLAHIKKEFRERGIINEKEFLELIK